MPVRLDVVVFTHDHEAFVEKALSSVLSQRTEFEISLRIHDDASTDRTVEVIKRVLADAAISWELVESAENRYASGIEFFQQFIAESRAEYVAILDGDDFWTDDEKLQRQVDVLDRYPNAALCHHRVLELSQGRLAPIDWPPEDSRRALTPGNDLAFQNVISTSSVVLRMSMFPPRMPEGFNDLRIGDYPMWALTTADRDIAFIDRAMSAYRIHDANIWAALQRDERFDRELEARIYIANNIAFDLRTRWRAALVVAIKSRLEHVEGMRTREEWEALKADLEATRNENATLRSSASWRLTRPLRSVTDKIRSRGSTPR